MTKYVRIGYARVSLAEKQNLGLELQVRALKKSGCKTIFKEEVSGSLDERKQMQKAIDLSKDYSRQGYNVIFYIYKLDRLGRHSSRAIQIIEDLNKNGVEVVSIKEQFDTSTPVGVLQYQMLATFAEFELNTIRQRTKEGLEQARLNGKKLGRPALSQSTKEQIIDLYSNSDFSVVDIAQQVNVGVSTIYKIIKISGINNRRKK